MMSLQKEAENTVHAMVAKAESDTIAGNGTHPIEVWRYIEQCVKEHNVIHSNEKRESISNF